MLQKGEWNRENEDVNSSCDTLIRDEVTEEICRPAVHHGNTGQMETGEESDVSSQRSTSVSDLPTEMLLEILKYLNAEELCTRVAPVCRRWAVLSRDPCLWKELYLCRHRISTLRACEMIRRMPLMREVSLHCRSDTNALVRALLHSCQYLECLEMFSCKGSRTVRHISAFALSKLIKRAPKFRIVVLQDTRIKEAYFYKLLQGEGHVKSRNVTIRYLSRK
jgi:hypothetical protein